jgi:hypothetical protein
MHPLLTQIESRLQGRIRIPHLKLQHYPSMQQAAGQDPKVLFQDFHGDVQDARHAGHHLGIMIMIGEMLTIISGSRS